MEKSGITPSAAHRLSIRSEQRSRWTEAVLGLSLAFAVAACGSSDTSAGGEIGGGEPSGSGVVSSDFVSGEVASGETTLLLPSTSVTEPSEVTTVVEETTTTTTSAPETTTTALPATTEVPVETTPDTQPEILALVDPLTFDGAIELIFEPRLRVHTAPGDPLNVRTGPGPEYPIVTDLPDGTGGLEASALHRLDSGTEWRYLREAGEPLGWVNSNFLAEACISPSPVPASDLITSVTSDVDFDGSDDIVNVYYRDQAGGTGDFYLEVELATRDVLSGVAFEAIDRRWMADTAELSVGRLVHVPNHTANQQIMVTRNGSEGNHSAFVLDIDGCDIVPTTLAGQPFSFALGDNVVVTTATCEFDVHGEVSLSTQTVDWTALANVPVLPDDGGEAFYTTQEYSLGGDLQWVTGGPRQWPYTEDSIPAPFNLSNCGFATSSGSLPR